MTTAEILLLLRRKINEVDPVSYTDARLLTAIKDAVREMTIRKITDLDLYTVDDDPTSPSVGVSPEPTNYHAYLMAYKAAHELLTLQFQKRVSAGEIGIIWTSGMESESTLEASKAYRALLDDLLGAWTSMVLIQDVVASRPQ